MQGLPSNYPKSKYDIVWLTAKIRHSPTNFPADLGHILK